MGCTMEREELYDVVIIGAGPAGIAAAIWCKRLGLHVQLLEKHIDIGGQLHQIHNQIMDYPGIIVDNGDQLHLLFKDHLHQLDISYRTNCTVMNITPASPTITIVETDLGIIKTKFVILASGSRERRLDIPGEREMLDRGEVYSSKKDVDKLKGKSVLIVGGGDRALEGACNIAPVAKSVALVHRSGHFRARQEFLELLPHYSNLTLMTSTVLVEIHGSSHVEAATLVNLVDNHKINVKIDAVLIRIGREPVQPFIPPQLLCNKEGIIVVDSVGRTNMDNIFAIGDLISPSHICSISNSIGQGMRAAGVIADQVKHMKEKS